MSRKRHQINAEHAAERVSSLKAMREELAKTYKLRTNDPRIEQAAITRMNQSNWEAQIVAGRPVPSAELEGYTNTIAQLLGKPPVDLNVRFVEGHICPRCQANTDAEAAAAKAAAEAKAALEAETPSPAPPAPNVVPLHNAPSASPAVPPPPPKRPTFAPAIDIATGQPRSDLLKGNDLGTLVGEVNARPGGAYYDKFR
jgi:hypothetical protein